MQYIPEEQKFSDDFYFQHEGINFLAKFQIPSKIWYFYNQDKPEYFGSYYDLELKTPSLERAKERIILLIDEISRYKK
jgi:hypothetical protein